MEKVKVWRKSWELNQAFGTKKKCTELTVLGQGSSSYFLVWFGFSAYVGVITWSFFFRLSFKISNTWFNNLLGTLTLHKYHGAWFHHPFFFHKSAVLLEWGNINWVHLTVRGRFHNSCGVQFNSTGNAQFTHLIYVLRLWILCPNIYPSVFPEDHKRNHYSMLHLLLTLLITESTMLDAFDDQIIYLPCHLFFSNSCPIYIWPTMNRHGSHREYYENIIFRCCNQICRSKHIKHKRPVQKSILTNKNRIWSWSFTPISFILFRNMEIRYTGHAAFSVTMITTLSDKHLQYTEVLALCRHGRHPELVNNSTSHALNLMKTTRLSIIPLPPV